MIDFFRIREAELLAREEGLRISQLSVKPQLPWLSDQERQNYFFQNWQWNQVLAELNALYLTHRVSHVMSGSEMAALMNAAREVQQLVAQNAAARNILDAVAKMMKIGTAQPYASTAAALAEPITPLHVPAASFPSAFPNFAPASPGLAMSPGIPSGRYLGTLPELAGDLRIETNAGVLSADLFRLDAAGQRTWVASLKTGPGSLGGFDSDLSAVDRYGAQSAGRIRITPVDESHVQVVLRFDQPLDGLPFGRNIVFVARFAGSAYRELGLELEIEKDVPFPPTAEFSGAEMSIESALLGSGLQAVRIGGEDTLPKASSGGWSEKDIEEQMYRAAQIPLDRPSFSIHVLWLSKSNRPGLLGTMFDLDDGLPRQGVAVFAGEIQARTTPGGVARKLIQTAVHEIGHALNLAHRFEQDVGQPDSTSFMNYDWRYRGGGRAEEFWRQFAYTFDTDELAFLRHAPYRQIVPGGAPFRSVRYWEYGNGDYAPYLPDRPPAGYKLELLGASSERFEFGEPVILGVRFTNETGRPLKVAEFLLDHKSGFLNILVQRVQSGRPAEGAPASFHAIMSRCFDIEQSGLKTLEHQGSMEDNASLVFGSSGFPFQEPGTYEVTAVLTFSDSSRRTEFLVPSNPLRIRIMYPATPADERTAVDILFRPDVGRWFALGGPERLGKAWDDLTGFMSEKKKGPIVAHIARTAMFGEARRGQETKARQHADTVQPMLKTVFDPVTTASTAEFIKEMRKGET